MFIKVNEIIRCEADEHYTYFFIENGDKIIVSRILKEYEKLLGESNFIRIHQSHLVNLDFIKEYVRVDGSRVIMSDNTSLPVSKRKRESFLKKLDELQG